MKRRASPREKIEREAIPDGSGFAQTYPIPVGADTNGRVVGVQKELRGTRETRDKILSRPMRVEIKEAEKAAVYSHKAKEITKFSVRNAISDWISDDVGLSWEMSDGCDVVIDNDRE